MKNVKTLLLLASIAFVSQGAYAESHSTKIQDADCLAAFTISSAADSCRLSSATLAGDASCHISASCATPQADWRPNSITIPYTSVASLKNCKGYLSVGGC